jgi:hypothetical protein
VLACTLILTFKMLQHSFRLGFVQDCTQSSGVCLLHGANAPEMLE